MEEPLEYQPLVESVEFLDKCFDNTFVLQNSLIAVKKYLKGEQNENENRNQSKRSNVTRLCTLSRSSNNSSLSQNFVKPTQKSNDIDSRLSAWGLPEEIVLNYQKKGIVNMFEWQVSCLANSKVLLENANLVYSAPTSAGKTLVSELLAIKTVLERQKKVLFILPFVSVVREKMIYFQQVFSSTGVRVEGFMGSNAPPGGFQAVHIAICTIEKANSLVNRLMDEGDISEIGTVIVDEMHLLGDSSRGYILELLLTKIKYVSKKLGYDIQIIGMSATLPNLDLLAKWLDAELFVTDFRPIPLEEYCLVGNNLINKTKSVVRSINKNEYNDSDYILQFCLETIKDSCSILVFCNTKNWCESLAQMIATNFYKIGSSESEYGQILRDQLKAESIKEVLEQLKNCAVGLDQILKSTVSFGVGYHHAGLTFDERDIIEGGFKSGALRVLVATSTLSSGVNLPARRVIVRSPMFQRQPLNILTYKQMIGRAGRMGKDEKGESILVCSEAEKKIGLELMLGTLKSVHSCIESDDKFMRAVLEVIASNMAVTKSDLDLYAQSTLLFTQKSDHNSQKEIIDVTLKALLNFELVRLQKTDSGDTYKATQLGKACLSSSMAPNDGLSLFCELQKARQCLVLETDLHLIYLVTPYSVSGQWGDIDWLHLLNLWESLTRAMKRVGELVGVQESFMIRCVRGAAKQGNMLNKIQIHKRFYTALALQDLVNEVPLGEVANKFRCSRGLMQSLQQSAATFAGMVTAFCRQLGWKNIEMLVSQFQDRLHFGIQSELLDLMRLPSLNGARARSLFNARFENVCSLASADVDSVENALHSSLPFQSDKERDDEDVTDAERRKKVRNIWITGHCGMTAREASINLIKEARTYLQHEIGVTEIKWDKKQETIDTLIQSPNVEFKDKTLGIDLHQEENHTLSYHCSKSKNTCDAETCEATLQVESRNEDSLQLQKKNQINLTEGNVKSDTQTPSRLSECLFSSPFYSSQLSSKYSPSQNIAFKDKSIYSKNQGDNKHLQIKNISIIVDSDSDTTFCDETHSPIPSMDVMMIGTNKMTEKQNSQNVDNSEKNCDFDITTTNLKIQNKSIVSPVSKNMSLKKMLHQTILDKKIVSIRRQSDLSIFSSEESDESIFEDTLPVDTQLLKLIDGSKIGKPPVNKQNIEHSIGFDLNSVINEFQSSYVISSDEENIKLYYEEDEADKSELIENFDSDQDSPGIDVLSNFTNINTPIHDISDAPKSKRVKIVEETNFMKISAMKKTSLNSILNVKDSSISDFCSNYSFVEIDGSNINSFCNYLDKVDELSLFFNISKNCDSSKSRIGLSIINENISSNSRTNEQKYKFREFVLMGIAFYFGMDITCYLSIEAIPDKDLEKLAFTFRRKNVKIKALSTRLVYAFLRMSFKIPLEAEIIDTSVMEWLADSDIEYVSMDYLMIKYCKFSYKKSNASVLKNVLKSDDKAVVCFKSIAIWVVADKQITSLNIIYPNLRQVLDTETGIARILADSECNGVYVDKAFTSRLLTEVKEAQEILQSRANRLCGYHLNFNSSTSVAKALGIFKGRKVSTKKSVLAAHNSTLSSVIIYWRKLNTILTKTLYPLTAKAMLYSHESRINPTYLLCTSTGRVSMQEPNLQSVPRPFSISTELLSPEFIRKSTCTKAIRDNLRASDRDSDSEQPSDAIEFNCRNIFKASEGYVVVSADYCQLEMRILTHMCEDKILTAIMNSDVDVFKSIAAAWSDIREEEVDDDTRQRAKQLCYGIIYGMGSKALSQQLDVSENEAAVFMESFHRTYPAIRPFTEKAVSECRSKGFVETLMKRRRYLPKIASKKVSERSAAERQAVNTIIQGSAADIAKSAMCSIEKGLHALGLQNKVRLILQLHDELIYEVETNHRDCFLRIIKDCMEKTVHLNIPLPVKVKSGTSWGCLEEVDVIVD